MTCLEVDEGDDHNETMRQSVALLTALRHDESTATLILEDPDVDLTELCLCLARSLNAQLDVEHEEFGMPPPEVMIREMGEDVANPTDLPYE
jgi:hypothetical protein